MRHASERGFARPERPDRHGLGVNVGDVLAPLREEMQAMAQWLTAATHTFNMP